MTLEKLKFTLILFAFLILSTNLSALTAQTLIKHATILPNHSGYLDLATIPVTYHVVGEISNVGTASLQSLAVNATFYDENNTNIASKSSSAFLDVLLPGRVTPFEIVWVGTMAYQIHNYTLSLQFEEFAGERAEALQVSKGAVYVDEAGFQKINGTVRNLVQSNATAVKVVATFYDAQGKVVSVAYDYTYPSTIMPMQTEPFELELNRKGVNFSSYSLTTESMEYAAVSPEVPTLTVLLNLDSTTVNSGTNASVQVHVANVIIPIKDATVQLVSDKGGVFSPQLGYTNSNGSFTATYTAPTVTQQTSITITATATKTGFIVGQSQKQVQVNPVSSPDLTPWTYIVVGVLAAATLVGVIVLARRDRQRPRKKTHHVLK